MSEEVEVPTPQGGEQQETDWKSEARKWEQRAKANKTAADELEQLKQSQLTEQQKAQAKAEKLQKELDAFKTQQQQAEWRSQVAQEAKIPSELAGVLKGDSLEELQENAKLVSSALHPAPKAPRVPGVDRQPESKPSDQQSFINQLFGN
jgi:hypothetical protein